jgi:hypothetical protein
MEQMVHQVLPVQVDLQDHQVQVELPDLVDHQVLPVQVELPDQQVQVELPDLVDHLDHLD